MPPEEAIPNRPTIRDVARAAGVSVAAASHALNGKGRISEERRRLVQQVATELGFRPSAAARALSGKKLLSVGLLTNDKYGRFSFPIMAGIAEVLRPHGVAVLLCAVSDDATDAKEVLDALMEHRIDGLIVSGRRADLALPIDFSALKIPVVYALSKAPDGSHQILPDDMGGAVLATEALLRQGLSRLAHVTGAPNHLAAQLRAEGFRSLAPSGAPVLFGEWSEIWGREAVSLLLDRADLVPHGIFCGSDQIARGVIDALRDRDLRVPEDVCVVGFDNWDVVALSTRPPLSTIDQQLEELGRRAGQLVLDLSGGNPVKPGPVLVPCRLVERGSSSRNSVLQTN